MSTPDKSVSQENENKTDETALYSNDGYFLLWQIPVPTNYFVLLLSNR